MQREVVAAPNYWTVGDVIKFMRKAEELPEQFYHVIFVDPKFHPVGNVTLGRMMSSKRSTGLASLKEEMFRAILADQDEAEGAYAFNQYHLISAPVLDHEQRLAGMITTDDAMMVLDHEHEEDILRLARVGESSLSDTILEMAKQALALAILMSIVASIGGNSGTQQPDGCGEPDCDQRFDSFKSGADDTIKGYCGAFEWSDFSVGDGRGWGNLVRIPRAWIHDRAGDGDQFGYGGFGRHWHSGSPFLSFSVCTRNHSRSASLERKKSRTAKPASRLSFRFTSGASIPMKRHGPRRNK